MNKKPETWNNPEDSGSQGYSKFIGIYFDGNITHLPDYIIESPAYKKYENNIINLNNEIPRDIIKKIIPFITKVMNHNQEVIHMIIVVQVVVCSREKDTI